MCVSETSTVLRTWVLLGTVLSKTACVTPTYSRWDKFGSGSVLMKSHSTMRLTVLCWSWYDSTWSEVYRSVECTYPIAVGKSKIDTMYAKK